MLTVSTIVSGAFRLVRERPVSVLTWGIAYIVATFTGMLAVMLPIFRAQMALVATGMQPGTPPGTLPPGFDPAAMVGSIYLFDLIILVLFVVLLAAGMRAVLRPDARAFAYMRLGMDELRLLGLCLLAFIVFLVVGVVLGIVIGIVAAIAGSMAPTDGFAGVRLMLIVVTIGVLAIVIFLQVRLSLCLPLTMIREKITITEAWRLTRGRFWTLFGGYFVLWLILTAIYVAVVAIVAYPVIHALMAMPGVTQAGTPPDPAALSAQLGGAGFGLIGIFGFIAFVALAGVGIAFAAGGITTATAALLQEADGESGLV